MIHASIRDNTSSKYLYVRQIRRGWIRRCPDLPLFLQPQSALLYLGDSERKDQVAYPWLVYS